VGQAPILRDSDDVIDTKLPGNLRSAVDASVVDNQNFDGIEPFELAREISQCQGQRVRFIEARDLDNQFHGSEHPVPSGTHLGVCRLWGLSLSDRRFVETEGAISLPDVLTVRDNTTSLARKGGAGLVTPPSEYVPERGRSVGHSRSGQARSWRLSQT